MDKFVRYAGPAEHGAIHLLTQVARLPDGIEAVRSRPEEPVRGVLTCQFYPDSELAHVAPTPVDRHWNRVSSACRMLSILHPSDAFHQLSLNTTYPDAVSDSSFPALRFAPSTAGFLLAMPPTPPATARQVPPNLSNSVVLRFRP